MDDAFVRYLEVARAAYHEAIEQFLSVTKGEGTIRLSPSKPVIIREVTEEIEQSMELHTLTQKVLEEFDPRYSGKIDYCRKELSTFFRRSGCYIDLYEGIDKTDAEYLDLLRTQLELEEVPDIWLALLDGAQFSEKTLEFENFSIKRFNSDELDKFFDKRVAEIFYPYSVIDSNKFSDYWFLVKQKKAPIVPTRIFLMFRPVWRYFKEELQAILLHPADDNFFLPWFARKIESLLYGMRITIEQEGELLPSKIVFDQHGNEGEIQWITSRLDDDGTRKFKEFVPRCYNLLEAHATGKDAEFIQTSLKFFLQAIFKLGPHGMGPDEAKEETLVQLVTAIEALIGERGEGLTEKLANRIAILLGENEEDTLTKWNSMKKFYGMRSDIVHGNLSKLDSSILGEALGTLPNWVRKVTIRMASLLADINTDEGMRKIQDIGIPSGLKPRQTCLRLIDQALFSTKARKMVREAGKDLMEN